MDNINVRLFAADKAYQKIPDKTDMVRCGPAYNWALLTIVPSKPLGKSNSGRAEGQITRGITTLKPEFS